MCVCVRARERVCVRACVQASVLLERLFSCLGVFVWICACMKIKPAKFRYFLLFSLTHIYRHQCICKCMYVCLCECVCMYDMHLM